MGISHTVAVFLTAVLSSYIPPVLNPTVYRSSDGEFELDVNPSEPDGSGGAHYRLTRSGAVVWEGEHPFTFFNADAGSDGTVAGVAYSRGLSGGGLGEDYGDLRLVVLDPDGTVRFEEVMPRRWSGVIHGQPVPQSEGALLDEENGRVLLRMIPDGSGKEDWRFYDLRTGELQLQFDPKTLGEAYLIDVRRLRVGFCILVHSDSGQLSRFQVLDSELRPIWSHEIPREPNSERHQGASINAVTTEGFTLERKEVREIIDFTVTSHKGDIAVREINRRTVQALGDPLLAAPEVVLPQLGIIELGRDSFKRNPVRRVIGFDIDGHGRLGFVRCDPGAFALVVVDVNGNVLTEIPLESTDNEMSCPSAAWLGAGVWAVVARGQGDDVTTLHSVDVTTKKIRLLAELETELLISLRSYEGQGLLVLQGFPNVLLILDVSGKESVRLEGDNYDERTLFSPADVTALPDGGFAVLDNIRDIIQIFRADGVYVDTIDLEALLGKVPSYPASITAASDGRLAIWDFGAKRPLLLLTAGRALLAELAPRYDDGRPTDGLDSLRYSPDGALWASDGEALLRLSDEGVVDAVAGARPSETRLTEVAATARDSTGKYYLLDRRTASIHVFDSEGMFSHRCDPAPNDFNGHLFSADISVAGDGTVYLSNRDSSGYVIFDANGRRVEKRPAKIDTIKEDWYAHPRGLDRWITTMEDLYLTDAEGAILHRIRRHGDRSWLDYPGNAAVASDGMVALLTRKRGHFDKGATLGVFTIDGAAILTKHFPTITSFASISFENNIIAVGTESQLILLDGAGELIGRFSPPLGYDLVYWSHFLADDGRELQLLNTSRRLVYRYDLSGLGETR